MIAAAPVNFAAFQSPGCTDSHSRLRLEISSEDSEQRHVQDALGCFKPLTRKKTRPEVVHVPCRHRRTEQAEEDRQDQGRIWASNAKNPEGGPVRCVTAPAPPGPRKIDNKNCTEI